jgi:Ankyrin repeat
MSQESDLLAAFESHRPDDIRRVLAAGVSPTKRINGALPIDALIEMYLRSPMFAECLKVMLAAGATIRNAALQAVLLDDDRALRALLREDPSLVAKKVNLSCAFTPLRGASLLHVCAEYNRVKCAKALLKSGADVNRKAAVDNEGMGGHTPIFHTVNSHQNFARPMMELLIESGADVDVRLKGLRWGQGFDWETVLYDVSVLSYTQSGLLKQFQRSEEDIYSNVARLYLRRHGEAPTIRNVPNKYLAG